VFREDQEEHADASVAGHERQRGKGVQAAHLLDEAHRAPRIGLEISAVDRLPVAEDETDEARVFQRKLRADVRLAETVDVTVARLDAHHAMVRIRDPHAREPCAQKLRGGLGDRLEHLVRGRRGDDELRERAQRLQLGRAILRALVEPRVLDGHGGLRREDLRELDGFVCERPDLVAIDDQRAHRVIAREQGHRQHRTVAFELHAAASDVGELDVRIVEEIRRPDRAPLVDRDGRRAVAPVARPDVLRELLAQAAGGDEAQHDGARAARLDDREADARRAEQLGCLLDDALEDRVASIGGLRRHHPASARAMRRCTTATSSSASTGFATCASKPAARARTRSSIEPYAVTATAGRRMPPARRRWTRL
jgi:hypothetical protein